ncbi:hypothetical protein E2C01_000019 [Portunus trituberculatus]|uniref:Uncharacterized protein n=1 Tax=Portunus trituberculatus TaxID=210409 RepID=A0A5B7CDH7_PORTR|nr:hypothetical protein [Portunus trituberculatus]
MGLWTGIYFLPKHVHLQVRKTCTGHYTDVRVRRQDTYRGGTGRLQASSEGGRRISPMPPPLRKPWFSVVTMHMMSVEQASSFASSTSAMTSFVMLSTTNGDEN